MKYTEFKAITENYWEEIQSIVLDSNKWVWLDYQKKKVIFGSWPRGTNVVPATLEEYLAFMRFFYARGVSECWFRELKQYCDFYGRSKDGRKYFVTFEVGSWNFEQLLLRGQKLRKIFEQLMSDSEKYAHQKEIAKKKEQNADIREPMAEFFLSFADFLKKSSK